MKNKINYGERDRTASLCFSKPSYKAQAVFNLTGESFTAGTSIWRCASLILILIASIFLSFCSIFAYGTYIRVGVCSGMCFGEVTLNKYPPDISIRTIGIITINAAPTVAKIAITDIIRITIMATTMLILDFFVKAICIDYKYKFILRPQQGKE